MQSEGKNCQNCKMSFTVEPVDFEFYKKIGVPAPTFCPDCRMMRRMSWRNERALYKRKCNAPEHTEEIISMYAPEGPYTIYDPKFWWSDSWDPMASGTQYDFSRPFFEQFSELLKRTPLIALSNLNAVNSDYINYADDNKSCYLSFAVGWNENLRYGNRVFNIKDSQDVLMMTRGELCYESVNCIDSYRLFYSIGANHCTDSYFLYNCRNCINCVGCANLSNKSYCIFNVQYSKEEYDAKLKELRLDTYEGVEQMKERFYKAVYLKTIHRFANLIASEDCTGDGINHGKRCKRCFDIYENLEDGQYLFSVLHSKETQDGIGLFQNEYTYESVDCNRVNNTMCNITVYDSHNVQYSWNCHSVSDCFGCTGLRGKKYCILNRQYTKEEYEALLPKIIAQMKATPYQGKNGRVYSYGEFFPTEISPFCYNETIAQEYFPRTREEIGAAGFLWREDEHKQQAITLSADQVPGEISAVQDSITHAVIGCADGGGCTHQCTSAFRIIPQEVEFYRALKIPPPRLCPNCRHYRRLAKRTPLTLSRRSCMCGGAQSENMVYKNATAHAHGTAHCLNKFETPYDPGRPEIVYCEECHRAEVV